MKKILILLTIAICTLLSTDKSFAQEPKTTQEMLTSYKWKRQIDYKPSERSNYMIFDKVDKTKVTIIMISKADTSEGEAKYYLSNVPMEESEFDKNKAPADVNGKYLIFVKGSAKSFFIYKIIELTSTKLVLKPLQFFLSGPETITYHAEPK